jgi:hypothetical protein
MHFIDPSVYTILNIKILLLQGRFEDILQLGQIGKMVVRPILDKKFEKYCIGFEQNINLGFSFSALSMYMLQ